jgi:hypothetical protein
MLKLTFTIPRWAFWDDIINELVDQFYSTHKKVPNVLLANGFTRDAINLFAAAAKENLVDADTGAAGRLGPDEDVELRGFQGNCYKLEIRADEDLPPETCVLAYDPALGDGEPVYD